MLSVGVDYGEADDFDEYEQARCVVLRRVLEEGDPLHSVRAALAVVKMMGGVDSPYGKGFAKGLAEVEAMDRGQGVVYLRNVPVGKKVLAYLKLGLYPALQHVLDCYRVLGVVVPGFWIGAQSGAMRLVAPGTDGAVWYEVRGSDQHDGRVQGQGFCYLNLIQEQYVDSLTDLLGPSPTFEQLMMIPSKCFVSGWGLQTVARVGAKFHVPDSKGVIARAVFARLAKTREWPPRTMGAACRQFAHHWEDVPLEGMPELNDELSGVDDGDPTLGVTGNGLVCRLASGDERPPSWETGGSFGLQASYLVSDVVRLTVSPSIKDCVLVDAKSPVEWLDPRVSRYRFTRFLCLKPGDDVVVRGLEEVSMQVVFSTSLRRLRNASKEFGADAGLKEFGTVLEEQEDGCYSTSKYG